MLTINKISKSFFQKSCSINVFGDKPSSRCHAELFMNNVGFKLSWSSDLPAPAVLCLSRGVYAVGIDTNVAIVDFNTSKVLKVFALDFNFHEFLSFQQSLYVFMELEVLEINKEDYSIKGSFLLKDVYESYSVDNGRVFVKSMDGSVVSLMGRP